MSNSRLPDKFIDSLTWELGQAKTESEFRIKMLSVIRSSQTGGPQVLLENLEKERLNIPYVDDSILKRKERAEYDKKIGFLNSAIDTVKKAYPEVTAPKPQPPKVDRSTPLPQRKESAKNTKPQPPEVDRSKPLPRRTESSPVVGTGLFKPEAEPGRSKHRSLGQPDDGKPKLPPRPETYTKRK